MNALAGTRFKIIHGYPGGNEINLATEKGEVAGRGSSSWATWKARPNLVSERTINVLVQIGLTKSADLPLVPLLMDLAANDEDRAILKLLSAPSAIGHPLTTSPGVPADRVKALRDAFDATMKDSAFLDEARRAKLEIDPVGGIGLARIAAEILSSPKPIRDKLASIILVRKR